MANGPMSTIAVAGHTRIRRLLEQILVSRVAGGGVKALNGIRIDTFERL